LQGALTSLQDLLDGIRAGEYTILLMDVLKHIKYLNTNLCFGIFIGDSIEPLENIGMVRITEGAKTP